MKKLFTKIKFITSVLVIALVMGLNLTPAQAGPELSGELTNTMQVGLGDPYPVSVQQELQLTLERSFGDAAIHLGIQGVHNWPKQDQEWSLGLDEAYLDYYGKEFDLRVGKQRINWGTALQVNPTSVLNPANVANPLGPKLPVYALNLDYYFGDIFKLTGVYLPFFTPALRAIPGNPLIEVVQPSATLANGEFALKLSAMGLAGSDFSLSYFRGKEDLPTPVLKPGQPPQAHFRDVQVFGADLATTVGEVGLWAEGAYSLPAEGKGYFSGIVGGDYGLENGLIVMGQYLYQNKDQHTTNLMLLGINQSVGLHHWRVGGVYNFRGPSFMLNPEFSFSLATATDLILGARYFANNNGPVGILPQEQNAVYVQLKVSF